MVSCEEIIRRACKLGYDVEIAANQRRRAEGIWYNVGIFRHSATAQPGYEYVRIFSGNRVGAIAWIEEAEEKAREQAEQLARST